MYFRTNLQQEVYYITDMENDDQALRDGKSNTNSTSKLPGVVYDDDEGCKEHHCPNGEPVN